MFKANLIMSGANSTMFKANSIMSGANSIT
jgi:hypothetical protein